MGKNIIIIKIILLYIFISIIKSKKYEPKKRVN